MKADLEKSIPAYQLEARRRGMPMLGSGAIYPVSESRYMVDDFAIPTWWKLAYGMDVGWNRTAAVWGALDPQSDVVYLYSEYYQGEAEPASHGLAIRARGDWIPGAIDPAARGRSQVDGIKLLQSYRSLGLDVVPADNAVEAGILNVLLRMTSGRLKVFKSLTNWQSECRQYHRDEKGKLVKDFDHLMDATRYLLQTGIRRAISQEEFETRYDDDNLAQAALAYGRSAVTGY